MLNSGSNSATSPLLENDWKSQIEHPGPEKSQDVSRSQSGRSPLGVGRGSLDACLRFQTCFSRGATKMDI